MLAADLSNWLKDRLEQKEAAPGYDLENRENRDLRRLDMKKFEARIIKCIENGQPAGLPDRQELAEFYSGMYLRVT